MIFAVKCCAVNFLNNYVQSISSYKKLLTPQLFPKMIMVIAYQANTFVTMLTTLLSHLRLKVLAKTYRYVNLRIAYQV